MSMVDIIEELSSSLRTKKVTLQLPMGNGDEASAEVRARGIEFTRDEFLGLYDDDVQDQIADILLKSFVEKYVMHYDLLTEDVARSIASMKEVAEYLDRKLDELGGKLPKAPRGLIRILDMYRSNCITHAKAIEKQFEFEYKARPSDWLPEPLREFRLSVYPLVRTLIDTLPDQDPVKEKALRVWYEGRKLLLEEQKDQTIPLWWVERQEIPGDSLIKDKFINYFIYGIGSVLEVFPSPERFDVWRVAQDVPINEWPLVVRGLLAELREDASQRGVSS